jgi:hypothetical protein
VSQFFLLPQVSVQKAVLFRRTTLPGKLKPSSATTLRYATIVQRNDVILLSGYLVSLCFNFQSDATDQKESPELKNSSVVSDTDSAHAQYCFLHVKQDLNFMKTERLCRLKDSGQNKAKINLPVCTP